MGIDKKDKIYDNVSSNSDLSNKGREDYLTTHSDIKEIGSKMYYDVYNILRFLYWRQSNTRACGKAFVT